MSQTWHYEMKLAARRLSLFSILLLLQSSALGQTPSAQVPATDHSAAASSNSSKTSPLDKWVNDVDSTNFSQKTAQGSIDGVPFRVQGAHFEKNQVQAGYYLIVTDAAVPPNAIYFGLARLPSYYYGKTIVHHFDNFKDPDIGMGMTSLGTSDANMVYRGTSRTPAFALKLHMDKPNAKGLIPCYLIYRAKIEPRSCLEGYVFAKAL
jgi:hypothetical protein